MGGVDAYARVASAVAVLAAAATVQQHQQHHHNNSSWRSSNSSMNPPHCAQSDTTHGGGGAWASSSAAPTKHTRMEVVRWIQGMHSRKVVRFCTRCVEGWGSPSVPASMAPEVQRNASPLLVIGGAKFREGCRRSLLDQPDSALPFGAFYERCCACGTRFSVTLVYGWGSNRRKLVHA